MYIFYEAGECCLFGCKALYNGLKTSAIVCEAMTVRLVALSNPSFVTLQYLQGSASLSFYLLYTSLAACLSSCFPTYFIFLAASSAITFSFFRFILLWPKWNCKLFLKVKVEVMHFS
jgi:hypothetical protein